MAQPATLEELTAEVVRLKEQGVGSVSRVILFGAGHHREGEPAYTRQHIANIISNFNLYCSGDTPRIPVNIGLDHEQGGTFTGPSIGRVTSLSEGPGGILVASFDDMPEVYSRAVDLGLWSSMSCEVSDDLPFGFEGDGPFLSGVSFLGLQQPQLKWTDSLKGKVEYASKQRWRSEKTAKGRRIYSEAISMDEATKTTLVQIIKGRWPDISDDFLNSLTDEQIQQLASEVVAPVEGGAESTMAEVPPREELIAAIVAADPAQDRATLEAMTDEELADLWRQVTGASEFSETKESGTTVTEPKPEKATPEPVATVTETYSAPKPSALPGALVRTFSHLQKKARQLDSDIARREKAERHRTVKAYCDRWQKEGYVTPAEVDPHSTAPNLYHRLMNASVSKVRIYGQKQMSELDAAIAEIESRGPRFVRLFSEQIPTPLDGDGKSKWDKIREQARAVKPPVQGKTLQERMRRTTAPAAR